MEGEGIRVEGGGGGGGGGGGILWRGVVYILGSGIYTMEIVIHN